MNDQTEPAVLRGILVALVAAVAGLLVELGVPVSETVQDAIVNFLVLLAPIVAGVLIRRQVWSPASHRAAVVEARERVLGATTRPAKRPRKAT